jgi:uncharacterized protein
MPPPAPDLTRVRRRPDRAAYGADDLAAVLDAGFVCHVAAVRAGRPVVIPTLYARDGEHLILHGSPAAGLFRDLGRSGEVCVSVTHVDGIVLARSAFHHSINYRSAVIHGEATRLDDDDDKMRAMRALVEHIARGQWDVVRRPNADELRQTDVWSVPLDRASVKVRTGPPSDDADDLGLPVWAGVLPLAVHRGPLEPDPQLAPEAEPPAHLIAWQPDKR